MPSKNYYRVSLLLCFLVFFCVSCNLIPPVAVNGTPIITTGNSTPGDSATPQLNVWSKIATGVELRYEDWKSPAGDDDTVTIVRFDVRHVRLSVAYQPAHPLYMSDWMHKEQATAVINGGYFDQQNRATGLVISNGQVFGTSYSGFGGMLSVDDQGRLLLRYLVQQPYNPSEQLKQATQSAPMLVLPGGKRAKFSANATSSRRSVVAMDKQGRLLFIVSPGLVFTLDELADQLVNSDLSINVALNLDGGSSTGLYVNAGNQHVAIDSPAQLPLVIIVRRV